MYGTPFKTPLPKRTLRHDYDRGPYSAKTPTSSTESLISTHSDTSNGDLSLIVEFDEVMRNHRSVKVHHEQVYQSYLHFVGSTKEMYNKYEMCMTECRRLQGVLEDRVREVSDLEHKLRTARRLFDNQRQSTMEARKERDNLASEINLVREILFKQKDIPNQFLPDDMRRKLSFLNNNLPSDTQLANNGNQPLSTIKELNSTGSILSDFSYSRSADDLDNFHLDCGKEWKKHRPSSGGAPEPAAKKRRSSTNTAVEIAPSDTVRATTTLTVSKDGPITATSVIESVPANGVKSDGSNGDTVTNGPPASLVLQQWARDSPLTSRSGKIREHCFQQKMLVLPENCTSCEARIRFGRIAFKCKECKAICHVECKNKLPLPCIPVVNTPKHGNGLGVIGDYTPTTPPMVPAILIHCINEIELRGLEEVGIYRIPGSEREVKSLKERFLKGKGAPSLNQIDIHVICGTVKDFLRRLKEPLVTFALWRKFAAAVELGDLADRQPALYQVISELPQPNRDTMAYILLHLLKVSESRSCKMDIHNLSKIFGPTLVGYTSEDVAPNDLVNEMIIHNNVMEELLRLPVDYWAGIVNVETNVQYSRLQQTPSTDSLLRPLANRSLFTPNKSVVQKRQKYFPSPKYM